MPKNDGAGLKPAHTKPARIIHVVRFVGGGDEFIPGVPTRDLAPDRWERLPEATRQKCLATGLYEIVFEPPADGGDVEDKE